MNHIRKLASVFLGSAFLMASAVTMFGQEPAKLQEIIVKLNDPGLQKRVQIAVQEAAFEQLKKDGIELTPELIAALAERAANKDPADTLAAGAVFVATVALFSDSRLKEKVVKVGLRPDGIGVFEFSYLGQPTRWMGLIAQDVKRYRPDLVQLGPGGYYTVDYRGLGMQLQPAR